MEIYAAYTLIIITVDIFLSSLMFWTDWIPRLSSQQSKIERASMDGQLRQLWVGTNVQWPNGLSIDFTANRLYWCDAYTDRIESVSIDDSSSRVSLVVPPIVTVMVVMKSVCLSVTEVE